MESWMDNRMVTLLTEVKRKAWCGMIEQLTNRFDAQAIRPWTVKQRLLQTGARWTNRMIAWAEKGGCFCPHKRIRGNRRQVRNRVEKLEGGAYK